MTIKETIHLIKEQKFGLMDIDGDGELIKIHCGSFNIYFQLESNETNDAVEYIQIWITLDDSDDDDIFHEHFDNINEDELTEIFDWVIEKREILVNDLKKLNKCIAILSDMSLSIDFIKDYIVENLELNND
jgi:hypothetical protein